MLFLLIACVQLPDSAAAPTLEEIVADNLLTTANGQELPEFAVTVEALGAGTYQPGEDETKVQACARNRFEEDVRSFEKAQVDPFNVTYYYKDCSVFAE